MLMLFAMTSVAALTGPSLPRGLLSLFLGLALATVGIDLQSGQERYTFGLPELQDGVGFVVVVVGLFALAEVFCGLEDLLRGVPDARLGAVPAAAIILKDGAAEPEVEVLKAWLKERLIAYQVPVHIRYVPDFPRTPSMKPSAPGLQSLFEGAS